jgi:hypothetical protein
MTNRLSDKPPFTSECPKCGQERLLTGYHHEELAELLDSGADIEGYCQRCDKRWVISLEERADISRGLKP